MFRQCAPPPTVRITGGALAGEALRGAGARELETLRRLNPMDLEICSRTLRLNDGSVVACRREFGREFVDIRAPQAGERAGAKAGLENLRRERERYFYVIPGCVARYDAVFGVGNNIPDGALAGWSLGLGVNTTVLPFEATGFFTPGSVGETGLWREFNAFSLPGGYGSGLLYARGHIPEAGAFSVSCLFRLNAPLEFDYAYADKGTLSPILSRVLLSEDGQYWDWDCPGSISPLMGFCSPHLHYDWSESITYPWAPWNEDFAANSETLQGVRRIEERCPGAPLLAGGYPGSPFVDGLGRLYPHPAGFVAGVQGVGLFIYDGDRLMAAKMSDFKSQYAYAPVLSDRVAVGVWHFAAMTYEADGSARLYLAPEGQTDALAHFAGNQPVCALDAAFDKTASGVNSYYIISDLTKERISQFRMNPAMDIAMPRFFHYALSPGQVRLLQLEATGGVFVADEHEAGELVAAGYEPIVIGREA